MTNSNPGITVAFSAVVVELGDEWMISNGEFLKASIDLFTGTDEDGASSLSSLLRMTFMSGAQAVIGRMMDTARCRRNGTRRNRLEIIANTLMTCCVIISAASIIAAATKSPKDDVWLERLYKVVELLALNFKLRK